MNLRRAALAIFVVVLLLVPVLTPASQEFLVTEANYIGLYTLVVIGLVLLTGIAGLTSFGQAAFVGMGAYTAAYLTLTYGVSPWLTVWIGLVVTGRGGAGARLGDAAHVGPLPAAGDDRLGPSLFYLLGNLDFLGKYDGLLGIPALKFFGITLSTGRHFFYLLWAIVVLAAIAVTHLLDSRAGRALRAVKGGTTMPEAMGIDTFRVKVTAFVLAALLASISGWLFAHFQRTVNPSPFGLNMGIEYLFMAVLGGVGYVWGALVGAGVVQILKDQLQVWLPRLMGTSGNYEIIVFGVLLVLMLQYARDGIWAFVDAALPRARRAVDWGDAAALPARPRPPLGETVLDVRAARKEFGGLVAVNDVSFQVRAGEILGLIGPNGAGKSTTFNLVTGVLPVTRGEVALLGRRIDALPSREIARLGVARTFQHVKMLAAMTVLENVALGAHLRGRARRRRGDAAHRPRRGAPADEGGRAPAAADRHGRADARAGRQPRARPAAADGDRARARRRPDPAAARRAGRRPAPEGKGRSRGGAAPAARRGPVDPAGRARHGSRHGPGRSRRRDGVRHQAGRRHARRGAGLARRARRLPRHGALMAELLLNVHDLHAGYGRAEVLHGLTLTARAGKVITVIGPNGAGKSTLLNALMAALPARGAIEYDGAPIGLLLARGARHARHGAGARDPCPVRHHVGRGQPAPRRLPAVPARPEGQRELAGRGLHALPRLRERRAQLAGTLSGGERQMLAVGRALMGKPRLLMLDEPSLGLAPLVVRDIFATIAALRATGVTILLVEQNARAALEVADYGYVLEMGEIALEGPAADLARDPRVVETYLGASRKKSQA